jgi:hypothetical protein
MRPALTALVVSLALVVASGVAAHPPGSGKWSWTPALCKSQLKQYGVEIDDGRYFRAAAVYCGGLPECTYDRSAKRFYYDHFSVAMIDNNLVYRTLKLHLTGRDSYRVDNLRVYGRATTTAEVRKFQRDASALVAKISRQTQADCTIEP